MSTERERAIAKGVDSSFWAFMMDGRASVVQDSIEAGVETAFGRWLDAHTDELVAKIAEWASIDVRNVGGPE